MRGTVTIADVALRANVSEATVSRVLNRPEIVADPTVVRVRAVMEELRFRPNRHARALNGFRNRTVGLLFFDEMRELFQNAFWGEATSTVYEHLFRAGFECSLIALGERGGTGSRFLSDEDFVRFLDTRSVDGFVLVGNVSTHDQRLVDLSQTRSVMWGRPSDPSIGVPYVDSDGIEGAAAAVRYLAGHGRQHIAMIAAPLNLSHGRDRYEGYVQGLASVGQPLRDALVVQGDLRASGRAGYEAMVSLLGSGETIDAVFAAGDVMAVGALQAARARGKRVPQDIAIVGFDNSPLAASPGISLTTVAHPYAAICAQLVDNLVLTMSGKAASSHLVTPSIVVRESA